MDIQQLLDQRKALDAQIEAARRAMRTEAINKVKAIMAEAGLTVADITSGKPVQASGKSPNPVPAKYRDKSGNSWSGRGLQPKWLKAAIAAGGKLQDFAV